MVPDSPLKSSGRLCLEHTLALFPKSWVLEPSSDNEPGLGLKAEIVTKGTSPTNSGAEGEEGT